MSEEKEVARGDNVDEIIRLRDELYDQERQTGRWVAEAAKQERRADEIQQTLGRELQSASRTIERLMRATPALPGVQDEAEKYLADTFEQDESGWSTGYEREHMIDAYRAGWDRHRELAATAKADL